MSSYSTYPSFSRALSPASMAGALSLNESTPARRLLGLHKATGLLDILSFLPVSYRDVLKQPLQDLVSLVHKAANCQISYAKLSAHANKKTFPQQLNALHAPTFTVSKEFLETHADTIKSVSDIADKAKTDTLAKMIDIKNQERAWLEEQLRTSTWFPSLMTKVQAHYTALKPTYQVPKFTNIGEPHPGGAGDDFVDAAFVMVSDPNFEVEYTNFRSDFPAIVNRLLQLERAKAEDANRKAREKVEIKASADVEMGSVPTHADTIAMLDKRVAARIDQAVAKAIKVRPSSSESSSSLIVSDFYVGKRQKSSAQPERRQEAASAPQEARGWQAWKLLFEEPQVCRHWSRQEREQALRFVQQAEEEVMSSRWVFDFPSTYPDAILDLPYPIAIRCLLSRVDPIRLEAARFRSKVHLGPGVVVPDSLAIHVSSGLRYMFHSNNDPRLLRSAYKTFARNIRWRIFFMMKGEDNDKPYDPDYEFHDPAKKLTAPPESASYIEQGLEAGKAYIDEYLTAMAPSKPRSRLNGLVEVDRLEQYCQNNGLIITPTDKNLGTAIVTVDWFVGNCNKLLDDENNYELIDDILRKEILDKTIKAVHNLAACPAFDNNEQLRGYLVSKIPKDSGVEPTLPRFYAIPKIHKNWKGRPIMPCHSTAQSAAAKFASKTLKPLVETRRFVLQGTKDLARKLQKVELPKGKKVYIISGDIVAFYPNVDAKLAAQVVIHMYNNSSFGQEAGPEMRHAFTLAVLVSLHNLIFEFQGQTYLQKRGLAMGIAVAPDIAQLFASKYEDEFFDIDRPEWLFFGRYIDDCLGLVIASSSEEALQLAQGIQYPGLELEWVASPSHADFLDMTIWIDTSVNRLETSPFRKALNLRQRIPWASGHPLDVKRGTFTGEMSRLATLCTRRQEYREAVLDLAHLYIDRGYPIKLINKWIKLNLEIRWANRLRDPEERASSVFVLKSHFNPLWDSFNIHEMWDKIRSSWMNSVSSMPWCDNTRCENPTHFPDRAVSSRDAYNVGLKRSHIEYVWSNNELVDVVVDGPLSKRLKLRADGTYVAVGNATGVPSEQAAQPEPVRRYGKTEVFAPRAPTFCLMTGH